MSEFGKIRKRSGIQLAPLKGDTITIQDRVIHDNEIAICSCDMDGNLSIDKVIKN